MNVLLTRLEDESEKSAKTLNALGFTTLICPLQRIENLPLPQKLKPEAIILSSPRALFTVAPFSKTTPLFVVGESLKAKATDMGFTNITFAQNALGLMVHINQSPHVSFEWFSGETIAYDFVALCQTKTINRTIVYRLLKHQALEQNLCKTIANKKIVAALHFSADTASHCLALTTQNDLIDNYAIITHYCLSKRIASVFPAGFKTKVSKEPTEESLIACLMEDKKGLE